jgi:hypothetical protein
VQARCREGNFPRMKGSTTHGAGSVTGDTQCTGHLGGRVLRLGWGTVCLALACGGDRAPSKAAQTKAPETAIAESALAAMPTPGGTCPAFGLWQACSVEDRISRAGLAVNRREKGVHHDFMSVDGLVWETSRAEIQVFLYASEADRKKDTDQLDTVFVAPPGKRIMWRWPAQLVTSNNMAAIILSLNGRQAERIALALGAGLPAR